VIGCLSRAYAAGRAPASSLEMFGSRQSPPSSLVPSHSILWVYDVLMNDTALRRPT